MSQFVVKARAGRPLRRGVPKLPSRLRRLFWEYDFDALSWTEDRDLVISKVLENGTWDDICWLRRAQTKDELRAWIVARRGRGLDERRLSYWGLMLGIPERTVSAWTRRSKHNPWHGRARP